MVEGGRTPEGWRWRFISVASPAGPMGVLWTVPPDGDTRGVLGEFAFISKGWTGELAELRGPLAYGLEARAAAEKCLA